MPAESLRSRAAKKKRRLQFLHVRDKKKSKLRKLLDKAVAEAVKIPAMKRNPGPKAMRLKTKKSTKKKPKQKVKKKAKPKPKPVQSKPLYEEEDENWEDYVDDMREDPAYYAKQFGDPDLEDDIRDDPEYHAKRFVAMEKKRQGDN